MTVETAIDPRALRNAFGQFATGVTVVTTVDVDGSLVGMTANSFSSVSMEPPLVLFCPANHVASLPAFERAGHFVINVLSAEQQDLATQFARPAEDKFAGVEGALATFECTLYANHEAGDHQVMIGEVHEFTSQSEAGALLFHGGKFATKG